MTKKYSFIKTEINLLPKHYIEEVQLVNFLKKTISVMGIVFFFLILLVIISFLSKSIIVNKNTFLDNLINEQKFEESEAIKKELDKLLNSDSTSTEILSSFLQYNTLSFKHIEAVTNLFDTNTYTKNIILDNNVKKLSFQINTDSLDKIALLLEGLKNKNIFSKVSVTHMERNIYGSFSLTLDMYLAGTTNE